MTSKLSTRDSSERDESIVPPPPAHDHPDRIGVLWILGVLVVTMLLSVGTPLLGLRVFHGADLILRYPPWDAEMPADFRASNPLVSDTVDAIMPMRAELRRLVFDGDYPQWTGLPGGGTALGAVPHIGPLSPLNLPYLVLPLSYAPAAAKVLEFAVAAGFTFLFLRRLGLSAAAALVGALAFVNCGFQVVWTNWPQTHVGALLPALLWAVERAITSRTLGAFLPVTLVTTVMLLEGFPAVTLGGLLLAGVYALVRVGSTAWRNRSPLPALLTLAALAAAVAGGVLLAAVQVLPFLGELATIDLEGRAQRNLGSHLPLRALITTIIPDAFGSPADGRYWGGPNYIEAQSFIGVSALLLLGVGVVRRRALRLPQGVGIFLLAAAVVLTVLIYLGGPLLDALQRIPPFDINFIGRMRSLFGLVLACLAAVGFDALLRPGSASRPRALAVGVAAGAALLLAGREVWEAGRAESAESYVLAQVVLPFTVGVGAVAALAWDATAGRPRIRALLVAAALSAVMLMAAGPGRALPLIVDWDEFTAALQPALLPGAVGGAALVVAVALGLRSPRRLAVTVLPLLLAVESLAFANPFWPRIPHEEFYLVTDTHEYLEAHLGDERLLAEMFTLFPGTTTFYGLRSVTAHVFAEPDWRDLLLAADESIYDLSPTFPILRHDEQVATSPLFDRLAARFYVTGAGAPILGERIGGPHPENDLLLEPGDHVDVPLTTPVRALTVHVNRPYEGSSFASLHAETHDADGRLVGEGRRRLFPGTIGPFDIPLVEPEAAKPPVAATITLEVEDGSGAMALGADADGLAVAMPVVPGRDGLRITFVGGAVIYEREDALPRFRWAVEAETVTSARERLRRLEEGEDAETVLLDEPGPAPSGEPASVDVLRDGPDELVVEVDAEGDGYLVVADALREGWTATVDGEPAELRHADHALSAVFVGEGRHEVWFSYRAPGWRSGLWVSIAALLVLVALAVVAAVARRRDGGGGEDPAPSPG